jgi:bacteriochlorophyll 4-vinyl reductase
MEQVKRNLGVPVPDDRPRSKVVHGPQPFRHSHYHLAEFVRVDGPRGVVHDVYGRRVLRPRVELLRAIFETLSKESPSTSDAVLFETGRRWGRADAAEAFARVQLEFDTPLEKLPIGVVLETWWNALAAAGWGRTRFDLANLRNGVVTIDLVGSALVAALAKSDRPCCSIYAGLYAAALSELTKRDAACVEVSCARQGGDRCRFLAGSPRRMEEATRKRAEGLALDEIVRHLTVKP